MQVSLVPDPVPQLRETLWAYTADKASTVHHVDPSMLAEMGRIAKRFLTFRALVQSLFGVLAHMPMKAEGRRVTLAATRASVCPPVPMAEAFVTVHALWASVAIAADVTFVGLNRTNGWRLKRVDHYCEQSLLPLTGRLTTSLSVDIFKRRLEEP